MGQPLQSTAAASSVPIYFGSYTGGESKGIYAAEFSTKSGQLSEPTLVGEVSNPTFLAKHPHLPIIYSVSEERTGSERTGAAIVAWQVGLQPRKLTEIGRALCGSEGPCHVTVAPSGLLAAVAHYSGGSATLVRLDETGRPSGIDNVKHQGGSGVVAGRQDEPHVHCVRFTPDGKMLMVSDLGQDRILAYGHEGGKLTGIPDAGVNTSPGAGPRHFQFTPNGQWMMVINELNNSVASYRFDSAKRSLTAIDSAGTLPDGYEQDSSTAEIVVHPNGRFVYGSNRGHDSIAVFELDGASGILNRVEIKSAEVKTPRNFSLIGGEWLVAVGQDSNTGSVFKVDAGTGKLTAMNHGFKIPKSVCVLPWRPGERTANEGT